LIDYLPFIDDAIAYDDVLLVPKYSDIRSRSIPNISSNVGRMKLSVPVVSSPMDTVTEAKMALDIGLLGGLGIIHRFMTPEEQVMNLRFVAKESSLREVKVYVVPAIGVGLSERERFRKIISGIKPFSIDAVAIDIANGHSILMKDTVDFVRDLCGDSIDIIAGNVATGDGFHYLADLGVNAVRVGIGGGSICKTRIMTGFGVPTLTSVIASSNIKKRHPEFDGVSILADGGIRYPADLVKSIVAGADAIVAGKILAGTDSSPNEVVMISGEKKKMYRGMAFII
jgi:IMP dehydrogenase